MRASLPFVLLVPLCAGVTSLVPAPAVAAGHGARPPHLFSQAQRIPGVLPDSRPHRLYVSFFPSASNQVLAYQIVDGLVSGPPVLTYAGPLGIGASGPLAVTPSGQLITGDGPLFRQWPGASLVVGYPKDSNTEARRFFGPISPDCNEWFTTAIAAGPNDAMFVGNFCRFQPSPPMPTTRPWPDIFGPDAGMPHQDVVVWIPTSPTQQRFAGVIATTVPPPGLATDSKGNLYVTQSASIDVYANPTKKPALIRQIVGSSFTGTGLAPGPIWIDHTGELYVVDEGANTISAYPDTANGSVSPDRTIVPVGVRLDRTETNSSIAVSGNTLFATYAMGSHGTVRGVVAFNKRVGGKQRPLQTLPVINQYLGITVGL
jgi:hypothetical protein